MKKSNPNKKTRNKALTDQKLIDAVTEIFQKEGHTGLGVNKVARVAGVHKKHIYDNFKTFDRLVEQYVIKTDYWILFGNKVQEAINENAPSDTQQLISSILKNQFKSFYEDKDMQKLILWEVSTDSALMRSIHNTREMTGQKLLEVTDANFEGTEVNFRAIAALLVGGIYYTILHTRFNGGIFSDINISTEEGRSEMVRALEMMVKWAFDAGSNQKK
jgi:AcrR family transcriptional regulator